MRICYLARSSVPSRTANSIHVMKMAAAYAALGHEVTLIVPRLDADEVEPAADDLFGFYGVEPSFRVWRMQLPRRLPGTLTYGLLLPLAARRLRAELVHSRNLAAAWGASRWLRLPTVYELHDVPSENRRQRGMLAALVASERLLGLVTITRALRDHLRRALPAGFPERRLLVAPDGVDESAVELAVDRRRARRTLGLDPVLDPGDRRLAVYTGHLYTGRGIGLILDLARRRPDHRFLLVGGTPDDIDRRRRQAEGLDNVTFAGFVAPAEIPLYLRAADVLLMPYADRVAVAGGGDTAAWASPLKMFEYLAAGRPILASTLPVLQEVLTDGRNALLLPHGAPERWSQALARLRDDPPTAERLARTAREDAAGFTWRRRAERLLDELLPEPAGAPG